MTTLTGWHLLVRLVLRRDRVRLPLWVMGLAGVVTASAASLPPLYPDQESIRDYARLFGDNPALVAVAGPGHGFDDPNLGVILVNEIQLWACVGVALMSIFLVNRHTRGEEDEERTELVRANVVGRHAPTAAAVAVVSVANVVVAVACGAALATLDYGVAGSIALAGSFASCGLAFTAVAAVVAQLASASRASLGSAGGVLAAAFVARAFGDVGDNWLRWVSPIGWSQAVRAYADERWWTLGLGVAFAVVVVAAAFWVSTRRDLGSGVLPQRPGPERAPRWLRQPIGLALRLQRGAVVGWSTGLFAVGAVYGSMGQDVGEMIRENPAFGDFLAQAEGVGVTDSFLATSTSTMALLAAGFAISAASRPWSEETAGRVETVLAAPVSRVRWAAGHVAVAAGGTVVVLASGGLGLGLSFAAVSGDAGQVVRMISAALVTVPGVLVLGALAVVLFGASPPATPAAWAGLAVAVVVELFGELLGLPPWSRAASPLHHLPDVPAEHVTFGPLALLVTVAAVLVAAGLRGLRVRDLRAR